MSPSSIPLLIIEIKFEFMTHSLSSRKYKMKIEKW
jgi:hypothetical protein